MDGSACVIVPVLNEAAVLGPVLEHLLLSFDHVVCVDDGSTDGSAGIAAAAGAVVLRHAVNLGQGAALQTGFEYALTHTTCSHVVTFDADGQHDPADATAMLALARTSDVDVVLGTRHGSRPAGQPRVRRLVLGAALRFTRWTTGLAVSDTHNGLRVLNRRAVRLVALEQRGMAHASELLAAVARHELTWAEHPVSIAYTPYSLGKGQHGLNAVNVLYDLGSARLRAWS
ncbi:glycosyltransferase family 2 protein [Nocardioides sp. KIGAM211]|uniref:Glycosyltransferase family 2 protein n=1 Tax=Nocardioides luti TaxID=2761101 RepID=A0A7X0V9X5_9ACTN|nr:glycosyltransferase family 2 protein [Nocardioides luti]MBB6626427.1 glycosyltransferase family 2 protein [Nocardioides luti]